MSVIERLKKHILVDGFHIVVDTKRSHESWIVEEGTGKEYSFGKLSLENTDVVLRCNCADFRWRFNWYDHLDKSLYGRKRAKYESKGIGPPANPLELPGICKHLMKTAHVLQEAGIFQE